MSDLDKNTPKAAVAGRGVKLALAVSLALNLAVVGLLAGAIIGGAGGERRASALTALGLGPFAVALDRDRRADLRARIEGGGEGRSLRDDRREIGNALRQVQAALVAEPFDRSAAEDALGQSRGLVQRLQLRGHTALLDVVEDMDAEERAALSESLNSVMRRGGRRIE